MEIVEDDIHNVFIPCFTPVRLHGVSFQIFNSKNESLAYLELKFNDDDQIGIHKHIRSHKAGGSRVAFNFDTFVQMGTIGAKIIGLNKNSTSEVFDCRTYEKGTTYSLISYVTILVGGYGDIWMRVNQDWLRENDSIANLTSRMNEIECIQDGESNHRVLVYLKIN